MSSSVGQSALSSLAAWVRWIVHELLAGGKPLGEASVDEAYRRLLSEKGLSEEAFEPVGGLTERSQEEPAGRSLVLCRLYECTGVNALAADQSIQFNPRMTVLFGENASGKSGYVRILKRVADVRSAEPILTNVYAGSAAGDPKAQIVFTVGDEERTLEWNDEQGVAPLTRMGVFDSAAVSIHVDTDLTYVFTPPGLSQFTYTHGAIDAVRDRAEAAAQDARPRANPFLPRFRRGTAPYQHIETLGASSDLAALEALAMLPSDVEDELARRRARVDALRPESVASRLEIARSDRQLYETLIDVCVAAEAFDANRYARAVAEAAAADAEYERVTQAFIDNLGVDAARESWEGFIRAGEAVLSELDRDAYPELGDECIYCRQDLEAEAVTTVRNYRAWANDASARRRAAALTDASEASGSIGALASGSVSERLAAKSAAAQDHEPPVIAVATSAVAALNEAAGAVAARQAVDWDAVRRWFEDLRPLAQTAFDQAGEIVTALEAQEAERLTAFDRERAELADLEAAATLAALMPDIRAYVERARWADRLTTVVRPITGVLRSLTETAKSASDEFLNRGFEEQFEREVEMLHAPRVRLDFPGRRGQAARRKVLVPEHRLSDILSEGEQKVVALADFLAESSLRTSSAPLVFDDPVNSLDYKRLEYVVDRLFELSREHQVIVFTHNIWFAVELLSRFEGSPSECSYFDVSRSDAEAGIVAGGSHPRADTVNRLKAEINTLLQDAMSATGESQAALVERAYDKLRAWCEVVVEEEILQGVTKRYQPNVQMTKLSKIRADRLDEAVRVLNEIFEKACRVMGGHSQPLETLAVRPSLDEAKKDWEAAQAMRAAYLAE